MDGEDRKDNPLISIILPAYNREKLLPEAIESAIKQSYRPIEIIVIDDGSTDGTAQAVKQFGDQIRYYYQPNAGPAAARNLGIQKSSGEFLAFIDSDDLWPVDKLRFQMNCFEAFPEVEIVQGLVCSYKLQNLAPGKIIGPDIEFPALFFNLGATLIRKSVFSKVGFLDERLPLSEDMDFFLRARETNIQFLVQRKVALLYRLHGRNLTTGKDLNTLYMLIVLGNSIKRRRKAFGYVKPVSKIYFMPELREMKKTSGRVDAAQEADQPLVSVILLASSDRGKMSRALKSLQEQMYHPIELLVQEKALSPIALQQANHFVRIEQMEQSTEDPASQINAAIRHCNGEFIAFLDAAGEMAPEAINIAVKYLHADPSFGYVVGRSRLIFKPDVKYPADLIDGLRLQKGMKGMLGSLITRRSTLDRIGGFTSGLPGMEETDWLLRAKDKGFPPKMVPEVFLYHYVQPDEPAIGLGQMKSGMIESLRLSIQRKRNSD